MTAGAGNPSSVKLRTRLRRWLRREWIEWGKALGLDNAWRADARAQQEPDYCLAARLGGPDHQPYLCQRPGGHDGKHRAARGEWTYEW